MFYFFGYSLDLSSASALSTQPLAQHSVLSSPRQSDLGGLSLWRSGPLYTPASPIKITVKEPRIYSVTYDDIKAAGWDPAQIDPTKLQLKNMGKDIPILFYGEEDHSFDSIDYFIFYGEPIKSDMGHLWAYNKFISPSTYWLYYSLDTKSERINIFKTACC